MKIKYNRFGKITKILFDKDETPYLLSENFKSAEGGDIPLDKITAMMKQRAKLKRNKKIDKHRTNTLIDLDVLSTYGINKMEYYSFLIKKS